MPERYFGTGSPLGVAEIVRRYRLDDPAGQEDRIVQAILDGRTPAFLDDFQAVHLSGRIEGRPVTVTVCAAPDYLSLGTDRDHARIPLSLSGYRALAQATGLVLPTARIVEAIHRQARQRVAPTPLPPGPMMTRLSYFLKHDAIIDEQLAGHPPGLVSGQKKDLVLTNRLERFRSSRSGHLTREAIFGWIQENGRPIQPLSTVHAVTYRDYSQVPRPLSPIAGLDGVPVALDALLRNPAYAPILSEEGPIDISRLLGIPRYRDRQAAAIPAG